jgi:hypothetical protein
VTSNTLRGWLRKKVVSQEKDLELFSLWIYRQKRKHSKYGVRHKGAEEQCHGYLMGETLNGVKR